MIGQLRRLLQGARRRPKVAAYFLTLVALAGVAVYTGGRHFWRQSQFRAVEQALERRDFSEARALLGECLKHWPQDAELRLLAARAARQDGDFAEADKQLELCQRLQGNQDGINLERVLLTAQMGDPDRVEGYLLSYPNRPASEAVLVFEAFAQGYFKTQRLNESLYCLDRWLKEQPDNVQALLWRGQVLERRNDLEEAVASYRRAVAQDPDDDKSRRLLALALVRSDRAKEAVEHLERLRRHSTDTEILLGLARCRRSLGQVDEARRLLDEVLAREKRHAEALSEHGKLALQTGQPVEAERWLRRALVEAPYDRETNYTLYLCLVQQEREQDAAEVLETVERIRADLQRVSELRRQVAASPRDPSLRYEAGMIFLRNGQKAEGLRWLRSALELNPSYPEALAALAKYTSPTKE
jgi:tetratricopeptide (TPR) repeat protein